MAPLKAIESFFAFRVPLPDCAGASLLLAYSWLSVALDLAQMVIEVQKHLKATQFFMLNSLCFNTFPQK